MKADITRYVNRCKICHEQKSSQLGRIGLMGSPKNVSYPFQLISADLLGPYPKSKLGNCYLLVVVDWFTKFTFICRLKRALSKHICTYLEENIFLTFGTPQTIVVDNDSQFVSKEFKHLLSQYNITNVFYNTRYHPQVNNCERSNRIIGTAIRSYIKTSHREWDLHIPKIASAINSSVHEVTQYSPNFMVFGRHVPIEGSYYGIIKDKSLSPFDFANRETLVNELNKLPELYSRVAEKIKLSYERSKRYYDLRKRNLEFNVGDTVFKKNYVLSDAAKYYSAKLAPKYIKCTVHKKLSPLIYELLDENIKI